MTGRNPALDGIRGVAVLFVLMFHTTHMGHGSGVAEVIWRISLALNCGVEIFFVLSGFLITGILLEAKGTPDYFRNFYARRTLRIFPLYYAVVTLCALAPWILPMSTAFPVPKLKYGGAPYWLYLSNVWSAGPHPVLGVAWSLAVEEQFYLLWPMVVFLLGARALSGVCVFNILLGLGYRIAVSYGKLPWPTAAPVAYLDLLSLGALIALRFRPSDGAGALRAAKIMAAAAATFVVLIVAKNEGFWDRERYTIGVTAVGLFTGAAILAVSFPGGSPTVGRVFGTRLLRVFGKYSYAIYLIHSPLDAVVRRKIFRADASFATLADHQLLAQVLYWILLAALSLGLAWLSWNLYEKHFINLKRFFPRRGEADGVEPNLSPTSPPPAVG